MQKSKSEPWLQRRLLGLVESVTPATPDLSGSRISLVLDCVDEVAYLAGSENDRENLAIIRISSTPERLLELFKLGRLPAEGDWLYVQLSLIAGNPQAWALPASTDYEGPAVRTNVEQLRFVESERSGPPGGSSARHRSISSVALFEVFNPPEPPSKGAGDGLLQLHALFAQVKGGELHPRIMDVGQASCAALHVQRDEESRILGFFDVGAPLWFNRPSCPKLPSIPVPKSGFVVLSHWDFDHYAMALPKDSPLRKLKWFAPDQAVGPNCRAFRRSLGASLAYLADDKIDAGVVTLYRGLGASKGAPDNRNATGYVLRIDKDEGDQLLTGDAGYEFIPLDALKRVTALTVPHHGGKGSGAPPPAPEAGGRAVASYGTPNKYKHPDEAFLDAHLGQGWIVWRTAKHAPIGRGSRWL